MGASATLPPRGVSIALSATAGQWNGSGGSARVLLYGPNGNPITLADRAATGSTTQGLPVVGRDFETARINRASSDAAAQSNGPYCLLYDSCEGASLDTNKWIISLATNHTAAQVAATGIVLNSAGAINVGGVVLLSVRRFPMMSQAGLRMRARVRHPQAFGFGAEHGFGEVLGNFVNSIETPCIGAVWRLTRTGQYVPVISTQMNAPTGNTSNTEILGTPVESRTFRALVRPTDYFELEVQVWSDRCSFLMWNNTGVLINAQTLYFTGPDLAGFNVTHLPVMHRHLTLATTGPALQVFIKNTTVDLIDRQHEQPWGAQMAGQGYGGISSPTAYTQLANWTNNTTPTTRTLTNTGAAESTLGGLLRSNSIVGGITDYIMFGFQVPSPYTFFFTGISIPPPLNEVVAVATTATLFQYFLGFGSTAISLATATVKRKALAGFHIAPVGTAANTLFTGSTISYYPKSPVAIQAGRFLHVGCREAVGSATATETYLWPGVTIDGYFE